LLPIFLFSGALSILDNRDSFSQKVYFLVFLILIAIYAFTLINRTYFQSSVILVPLLTYTMVKINLPKIGFLVKNDLSYGIYIYGYPITQSLICFGMTDSRLLFCLTLALVSPLAYLSWRYVESPYLNFSNFVKSHRDS
jgi:peptidoglycan/LPS O-acetylase OafA/YrhL